MRCYTQELSCGISLLNTRLARLSELAVVYFSDDADLAAYCHDARVRLHAMEHDYSCLLYTSPSPRDS